MTPETIAAIGTLLAIATYYAWIVHLWRKRKRLDQQLTRQQWIARLKESAPADLPSARVPTVYRDTGGGRMAGTRKQLTIPPESE